MYSRALLAIPPTDVTALFSTAPVFVFLLSIVILREPPLVLRVSTVSAFAFLYVSVYPFMGLPMLSLIYFLHKIHRSFSRSYK